MWCTAGAASSAINPAIATLAGMDDKRRLSDSVLAAFNQACEQERLDAAELLLQVLELVHAPRTEAVPERRQRPDDGGDQARRRLAMLRTPRNKAFH